MHPQQHSIAWRFIAAASAGERVELPRAGTSLENPYVFDAVAREVKSVVDSGFGDLEILEERCLDGADTPLITELVFRRRS